jgi:hypothetical protein
MAMRWKPWVVLAVLAAGVPGPAQADEVERGTRVRVHAMHSSRPMQGKVVRMTDDTLVIMMNEHGELRHARIQRIDIDRLEIWRGTQRSVSLGSGLKVGAGIGGLVGLGLGLVFRGLANLDNQSGSTFGNGLPFEYAAYGAGAGGLLGLGVAAAATEDVWREVPRPERRVTLGLAPAPGRGWQAGIAVRF